MVYEVLLLLLLLLTPSQYERSVAMMHLHKAETYNQL